MKTIIGILLIIISSGIAQNDSLETQIQLKTYLEKTTIPQNRELVYYLELSWKGDLSRYGIIEAGDPIVTNLELRRSGSSNRAYSDEDGSPRSVKTISYYFSPGEVGMAYIDGVVIKYEDRLTKKQETLLAKRLGAKITDPLPDPMNSSSIGLLVIQVLAFLFLLTVVYFVFKYFQQKKFNQSRSVEIDLTLEDEFLSKLHSDIKSMDLTISEKTDWLAKVMSEYYNHKFDLGPGAGLEQVTELLEEAQIQDTLLDKMKRYADWVNRSRFAKENPSESDLHLFIDTFEQILIFLNTKNNQ